MTALKEAIGVFCVVAPEDEELCAELRQHLRTLEQQYHLDIWYPRRVLPGSNWRDEREARLADASIILLFLSAAFLDDEWCSQTALPAALQRQGTACILPILLRPVDLEQTAFANLTVLPETGIPVIMWPQRDAALLAIVTGIRRVLEDLLRTPPDQSPGEHSREIIHLTPPLEARQRHVQLLDAPHIEDFYGREQEIATLRHWIIDEHCRVLSIVGMGGIGKTSLAAKVVDLVLPTFEDIFWFSLLNAPPFERFLQACLRVFEQEPSSAHTPDVAEQANLLVAHLSHRRCLLIWDNAEALLQNERSTVPYREGYESYGLFARQLGAGRHHSCLLITSREQWKEVEWLAGAGTSARSLSLKGLPAHQVQAIAERKGLSGTPSSWQKLTVCCSGNPLMLMMLASTIREGYAGQISSFLDDFGKSSLREHPDVRVWLDQQFERTTPLEQQILYWLALKRVPLSLQDIRDVSIPPLSKGHVLLALEALRRRSWIESHNEGRFALPPALMDAVTDRFIESIVQEILLGETALLASHALLEAQAREYIRASQIQLILTVIAQELERHRPLPALRETLFQRVAVLRRLPEPSRTYEAGNILNLLVQFKTDLRDADFSGLTVRQAYLQEVDLPDVNFAFADVTTSLFADTFGGIVSVAWHPGGDRLAAGTVTGEIRIWETGSGQPLRTFRGHIDWVWSLAFSPDGETLASGSSDGTIRLWKPQSGRCFAVLDSHTAAIWSLAISPDGCLLASGSGDQSIRLWDMQREQCVRVLSGHTDIVRSVAFNQDGSLLASGSSDTTGRIWQLADGQCLTVLHGHTDSLRSVAFHPDGKTVASGSSDTTVRLWDAKSGRCLMTLSGHSAAIRSIAFHPDGHMVASGGFDRTVRVWDLEEGHCLAILRSHTNSIWALAFHPDGSTLASGGEDQTVHLWEMQSMQCLRILRGSTHGAWTLAFSPSGKTLACGTSDRTVRLWELEQNRCIALLHGHTEGIWSVAFRPDGETLASGSADQTVRLWHVRSGRCMMTLTGHTSLIFSVAFSPDGKYVASGSVDQTLRLWDATSGTCLFVLHEHTNAIRSVTFSPDGRLLASGSKDQTIRLWDVSSGACLKVLRGHEQLVSSVAFSPDGRFLVSGSKDQTVRLWDIEREQVLLVLQGHQQWVFTVAWSPDGQIIASGSGDQTVRLWEVDSGHCLSVLRGHTNAIRSVAFSPDGQTLGSSSYDGQLNLWDRQTYTCLKTLSSHQPYEGMNITQTSGLTALQKSTLKALGAVEDDERIESQEGESSASRGRSL